MYFYNFIGILYFRNSIGEGKIIRDSEQNVEDTSVQFNNNITTVRFSRPKITGDENDFSLDVCRYFVFAWGDVIDINTGEIDSPGMAQRFISEELICLPTSTSLCPEMCELICNKLVVTLHVHQLSHTSQLTVGNQRYH